MVNQTIMTLIKVHRHLINQNQIVNQVITPKVKLNHLNRKMYQMNNQMRLTHRQITDNQKIKEITELYQ